LKLELDIGRRRLFAGHDRVDKLVERNVFALLVIAQLSLLLFGSRRLVLRVRWERNGRGEDDGAGDGENATENHLENSCNSNEIIETRNLR
jgi:hypothetical protein